MAVGVRVFGLVAVALSVGCTTSDGASAGGASVGDAAAVLDDAGAPAQDDAAVVADAGAPTVDAGSAADDAAVAATPIATATMPDFTLDAGAEKTMCVTVRLTNTAPIMATKLTTTLGAGSHHFIAYRRTTGTENPTPTPCGPLSGITQGSVPMIISQSNGEALTFPSNTALRLEAQQLVRLEAHFVNTTSAPITGNGSIRIDGVDAASAPTSLQEANMAFWGTTRINIPARSTFATPVLFQTALPGTHGFALTTHQHRLGSRFRIWSASSAADAQTIAASNRTPLAETGNWDAPPLYMLSPQIDFDGTNGLAFQCEWDNPGATSVRFGESALSEMCFMWMYYWPSRGFDTCLNVPCTR